MLMTDHELPSEITTGADLRGNEFGWPISSFRDALAKAEALGYACLGGQFQFRLDDCTCEMYWLNADSKERKPEETWTAYCERTCFEVKLSFERIARETDFVKEAMEWAPVRQAAVDGVDPMQWLVFVAYFVDETVWSKL